MAEMSTKHTKKKNVDPKNKIKESAHGNIQIKEGWEE
jgi:hypothetical protein